ncbi:MULTISPECIES: TonB-dependent receptor [unclassified Gluconobacter]|uniref:TonB-dependent receptor n=1 Tax=unclassified Gluconobacter TaxID=2644261 RepID=UPI001C046B9E|nr:MULTISPECIES: TonB-dependent receptor [unclassified Gluconobacter]
MRTSILLGTTFLGSLVCLPAHAATLSDHPSSTDKHHSAPHRKATSLSAERSEVIRVAGAAAGGGRMVAQNGAKSRSEITQAYIAKQAPTPNVFKLLGNMPGANVASADPFGMVSGNMTIRGMNSDQIGFTVEGAPLNDIGSYMAFPTEWVDSENLNEVTMQQGSANLDSPTIGASGGLVTMNLIDPSHKMGGTVAGSFGSYNTHREYVRLQTGDIGNTGMRAFVAWSHLEEPHFRGAGNDHKQHIDAKLVKDWANGSRSSVALTFDDSMKVSYLNPSLSAWQQYGRHANYSVDFSPTDTRYWKLHQSPYRVLILSAPQNIVVNSHLGFDFTPYFYWNSGTIASASLMSENAVYSGNQRYSVDLNGNGTTNDKVMMYTPFGTPYVYRPGMVSKVHYTIGHHTFVFGYWFDWSRQRMLNPYSEVGANGGPANVWGYLGNVKLSDGTRLASYDNLTVTRVNSLFFGDTFNALHNRLRIEAGVKESMVTRIGYNYLPGAQYRTSMNAAVTTPNLGARYKIDSHSQIFADVATNFRTPTLNALYNTYSATTGKVATLANPTQKTEYSISEEIGYRYQDNILNGSITFFNYNFTNRQVATQVTINNAQITQNINAGGQTSRGVDVEIGLHPWHHLHPYISAEYLHATIDNNYKVGSDYLKTAGKTAVRSPSVQASVGLDYDDGTYFAGFSVKYVGRQFSTFMNDQAMPGYVNADMNFGYRMPKVLNTHPEVRLNLMNVGNNKYLSGVSGIAASSRASKGLYGTTIASQGTPTYYVAGSFAALATVKLDF